MVSPDVTPTEPTIHAKPILLGRYGEIENECVPLSECNNVQAYYWAPSHPVTLDALLERQDLADRLACMRG